MFKKSGTNTFLGFLLEKWKKEHHSKQLAINTLLVNQLASVLHKMTTSWTKKILSSFCTHVFTLTYTFKHTHTHTLPLHTHKHLCLLNCTRHLSKEHQQQISTPISFSAWFVRFPINNLTSRDITFLSGGKGTSHVLFIFTQTRGFMPKFWFAEQMLHMLT